MSSRNNLTVYVHMSAGRDICGEETPPPHSKEEALLHGAEAAVSADEWIVR